VAVTATVPTTVPIAAPTTPSPNTKIGMALRAMFTTAPPARTTIGVQASSAPTSVRLPIRFSPANGTPKPTTWR
jgi:hypothetical protein